jgi:4-diphosphocytidyl-2-C-methyl-D-erythritol kinase
MIMALRDGDLDRIGACLQNALEEPAAELVPAIREAKIKMLEAGACGAAMTGSGSAVFGLFRNREAAEQGALAAGETVKETYVTRFPGMQ